MTVQEKKDRLGAISEEMAALLAVTEGDDARALTDEEDAKYEALETEAGTIESELRADEAAQVLAQRKERAAALAKQQEEPNKRQTLSPQPVTSTVAKPKAPTISVPHYPGTLHPAWGANPQEALQRAYLAGKWLLATLANHGPSREYCKEHGVEMLYHNEGSDTAGGFLVFPEFESTIIDLRNQYGVFRRESKISPMGSDTKTVPRRVSGLTAYYVGENEAITASEKAWDQVRLTARKLAVLSRWSTELNEDSVIAMAADLTDEIAYAFAKEEDEAGFVGDGTSTYGRMTGATVKIADGNHAGSIVDAVSGNTAYSTLDLGDFEACVGKLPSYADANAKWYIHKAGWAASMLRLLDAAGGNTAAMLAGGTPVSFLGYPVVFSEVLNSTLTAQTSTIVALFGDLKKASTFGDRRGITLATSTDRYFEYDQIGIKGTERYHINVHDLGDGSNAGPLVALKTASS